MSNSVCTRRAQALVVWAIAVAGPLRRHRLRRALSVPQCSMGAKQLKTNAVTTKEIKNGAVIASKLNTTGLTVPNALHANSATAAVVRRAGAVEHRATANRLRSVSSPRLASTSTERTFR